MKRVLIFGSYANGNLGDAEQAASVVRHLHRYAPYLEIVSAAHCVADRLYYPGHAEVARNMRDILDPEFVNSFDAVFIGGGGLLAAKHRPMERADWVEKIKIPIVIFGVGANEDTSEMCRALVEAAEVVSVRDDFSLAAIRKIREDAFLLRDPILMDRTLDKPYVAHDGLAKLCVIPRKLVSKSEGTYREINDILLPRDFIVSFFPTTDELSGALGLFPERRMVPTVEMESFKEAASEASLVLSDRYHGCILSMKRGVPVLPLFRSRVEESSKIYALYKDMGMSDALYGTAPCISRNEVFELATSVYDPTRVSDTFSDWYAEFEHTSNKIFSEIGL